MGKPNLRGKARLLVESGDVPPIELWMLYRGRAAVPITRSWRPSFRGYLSCRESKPTPRTGREAAP